MLKIYNTLTRQIEEFKPLDPDGKKVGMYTCGPTVYNYQHIGNFRTMIFADTLTRVLKMNGYELKTVRNITDIDDKIIRDAKTAEMNIHDFTKKYEDAYNQDLAKLNIAPVDHTPHATEHIDGMIKFIEELIKKEIAYVEDDGSVYFDISKFADYGKLSQLDKQNLKTGTRILSDEYEKDNVQDFALWKSVEQNEFGYDSPWGKGRPGWHIECSVMSEAFLGETFDIHTGGIDLLFPHHENEIAQSRAKSEKDIMAKYFIHGEHVMVDNQKMSKSKGNSYLLKDLEQKGFDPIAFRYLMLTAHYRDKINFTWESLQAAQNALNNLRETVREWDTNIGQEVAGESSYVTIFRDCLNEDLSTSTAIAQMWELVKSDMDTRQKTFDLRLMDEILGLKLDEYIGKKIEVSDEVQKLIDQRQIARSEKDFAKSDQLRDEIKQLGYEVLDTSDGQKIRKL